MKSNTNEAYIMCKGWPDEPVKRMYFSRGLSDLLGRNTRIFLSYTDTSIILSSNQVEKSDSVILFDLKIATVTYSILLLKALTRLPGCPRNNFCLFGWEKLGDSSVQLKSERAVFKEGEYGP